MIRSLVFLVLIPTFHFPTCNVSLVINWSWHAIRRSNPCKEARVHRTLSSCDARFLPSPPVPRALARFPHPAVERVT